MNIQPTNLQPMNVDLATRLNSPGADALYLSWRLQTDDRAAAQKTRRRLNAGETQQLYRIRSWVIVRGEVQALLSPAVSLDRIASSIWDEGSAPTSSRWVRRSECAKVVRDMEIIPVTLGLAARPEQWPWSSAAAL
ncbi:MAG: hypothetical protein EBY17_19975 [Acidobacteriia bacterium]|nr:hypothetical protein [Terriglobia bacterium]